MDIFSHDIRGRRAIEQMIVVILVSIGLSPSLPARENKRTLPALKIPVTQIPEFLDPHDGNSAHQNKISKQVFDNLVRLDSSGAPIAEIANRWTIDRSNKTIEFSLNPNRRFHDGSPIDVTAVRQSLIRSIMKKNAIGYQIKDSDKCTYKDCPSIRVVQSGKLAIILAEHTYQLFLSALTSTDATILKLKEGRIIGSGPFRITSQTDHEVIATRVDQPPTPLHYNEIHFIKITQTKAVEAFVSGTVDELWITPIPKNLRTSRQIQEINFAYYGTYLFTLNIHSGVFSQKGIRLAVSKALDPQRIMTSLGREGIAATGFIPEGLLGHSQNQRNIDLHSARSLVTATIQAPNQRRLIIALHTSYREKKAFTNYIQLTLSQIGLIPEIQYMQFTDALTALKTRKADMLLKVDSVQHYDVSTIMVPLMIGNFANTNQYENPALDHHIRSAQTASSPQEKQRYLEKVEEIIAEDIPIIPLFYPRRQSFYSGGIDTGLKHHGEIRYWEFPYREFKRRAK